MSSNNSAINSHPSAYPKNAAIWLALLACIYLLLTAVAGLGVGFKLIAGGAEAASQLFDFAITHPIAGLLVGVLATSALQSSSTATSIIVGLVAGGLPVEAAVPIVMGANIGTTVTNTLVSLGQMHTKAPFERALQAATVHDFFNYLAVLLLLPLELYTGWLSEIAKVLANVLANSSIEQATPGLFKMLISAPANGVKDMLMQTNLTNFWVGVSLIFASIGCIFAAITGASGTLRWAMTGRVREIAHNVIGKSPVRGIISGAITTILVQSSSTTTSLTIPLASSGTFTLKDIYPFVLGANIGTTVTALLAATAIAGPTAIPALQIALVHFLYNLIAVTGIYSIPVLRNIPLHLARLFARAASRHKWVAILYTLCVFFLIPGFLLWLFN